MRWNGVYRVVKIREEADPFSMDLGTLAKGAVVRVLQVGLECCVLVFVLACLL